MKNTPQELIEKKHKWDKRRAQFPEVEDKLREQLKIKLVHSVNALGGSQLSQAETQQVITTQQTIGGKSLQEQNQVLLYAEAVEWLFRQSGSSRYDISDQLLIRLHFLPLFLQTTEDDLVRISYKVPYSLTEYLEWLHHQGGDSGSVAVSAATKLLQEKHFKSSSGRTALLVMNLLLLQDGYPLVFVPEDKLSAYKELALLVETGGEGEGLEDLLYSIIEESVDMGLELAAAAKKGDSVKLLKIGELAKLTQETIPTIRFWTREGLLEVAGTSPGGYQLYAPEAAQVALKIRQLQQGERKTIEEIRQELMAL